MILFFTEIEKPILKFKGNPKGFQIAKTISKKQTKLEDLDSLILKLTTKPWWNKTDGIVWKLRNEPSHKWSNDF